MTKITLETFTPGPWRVHQGHVIGADDLRVAFIEAGFGLTKLREKEECDANARLIAAAPAMHAALQTVLAFLDHDPHSKDSERAEMLEREMERQVRAVLGEAV